VSQTRDSINELANSAGTYFYSSLTAFAQDLTTVNSRNYSFFHADVRQSRPVASEKGGACVRPGYLEGHAELDAERRFALGKIAPAATDVYHHSYYNTGAIPSRSLNLTPRISLAYLVGYRTAFSRQLWLGNYASYSGQFWMRCFSENGQYQTSILVNPKSIRRTGFSQRVFAHRPRSRAHDEPDVRRGQVAPTLQPNRLAWRWERRLTMDTALTVT